MIDRLKRIIQIEWQIQQLHKRFNTEGPLIESLVSVSHPYADLLKEPINYLVMQGSFDPPTTAHLTLLTQALEILSQKVSSNALHVFIALSYAHVEKKPNVLHDSLFGDRIAMLETLIHGTSIPIPVTIGFSNVARYVDLISGFHSSFKSFNSLTFLMGTDVFRKILDSRFYSQPLEDVLPLIFEAAYLVAGRKDIFLKDEFERYLNKFFSVPSYQTAIQFLTMPDRLRPISATQIRDKISQNLPVEEEWIHPAVLNYIKNHNIYNKSLKWQSIKVAVQLVIHLTLMANKSQNIAFEILKNIIPEIETNYNLQKQLIEEYQHGEITEINRRWKELVESIF